MDVITYPCWDQSQSILVKGFLNPGKRLPWYETDFENTKTHIVWQCRLDWTDMLLPIFN